MATSMRCALLSFGLFLSTFARADIWITGNITDIQVLANGNSSDKVVVYGTFSPPTGCAYNAVELGSTDNYFKESYAALLAARLANTPVKILFSYCDTTTGFGRANSYMVSH